MCVSHGLRLEQSQAVLIITNAVCTRRLHGSRRLGGPRGRIWTPDDEHDREHADGNAGHHPRLNAARQDATRNRAMIRDGGRWRIALDARSRRGVCHTSPPLLQELESLFAECQIALVQHLRHDVRAFMHLEVQKGWLPVFDLIERRQFARVRLDVRELPVVPNLADEERLFALQGAVGELELRWILLLVRGDGFRCPSVCGFNLCLRLCEFRLKALYLRSAVVLRLAL